MIGLTMSSTPLFRVRRARLEDLNKVTHLETRVWKEMAAPHAVIRRRFFLYSQGFQVAVIGQEIVGFCCAALFDQDARSLELDEYFPAEHIPKGRYCFLFGLTVNPIYRRRGIARSLVGKELETARKKSCRKVQVIANSLSRPLFEQWHFRAVTELQHLFKNHTELMPQPVLMEMDLETD